MNMDAPDPILLEMGAAYNQPEPAQMWPPGQLFLPGFVTTPPRSQGSSPPLVDTACSMQNGMAQEPFPVFYPTLNGMAQGSLPPLANVVHPMPNQIGQFPQPTILVAPPPSDRRKHACPYGGCGKRFSNTSHAKRHINKHCGMRATCPVCSKDFTRTDNLKAHTKKLHPSVIIITMLLFLILIFCVGSMYGHPVKAEARPQPQLQPRQSKRRHREW